VKSEQFKNVLVIHFGQLGDIVLALPAMAAIRGHFSDAKLTVMSGKSTAEVLDLASVADEQVIVDRVELRDGNKAKSIAKIGAIVRDIRRRKFDLVIDLHSLPETNILSFLSGATHRLLARRGNRSIDSFSNFPGRQPDFDRSKHLTDQYLGVLEPLGISGSGRSPRITPTGDDIACVRERFGGIKNRIGLFPGAGHPSRCWPLANFRELASFLDAPVVFLGPEEKHLRSEIESTFHPDTLIVDGLSLRKFIAAVSLVQAFVTNDTGPLHLAAAVGTCVILLLDERAPTTYLPLSDNVSIVSGAAIDQIPVSRVLSVVDDISAEAQARTQ